MFDTKRCATCPQLFNEALASMLLFVVFLVVYLFGCLCVCLFVCLFVCRYTTKHLNSDTTPKAIRALLA